MENRIYHNDSLSALRGFKDGIADLIYFKPPSRDQSSGGPVLRAKVGVHSDLDDHYLSFLEPLLLEAYRILAPSGSLYFHSEYREVHYCKVFLLDRIFGRRNFLNEIIWTRNSQDRGERRWPEAHETILLYVKNLKSYTFNMGEVDRIPYMAPELVGPEKESIGKLPTDTWWHTQSDYPEGLLARMINASSRRGDLVVDPFAGEGVVGQLCMKAGRRFIMIESDPEQIRTMVRKFDGHPEIKWIGVDPSDMT